MINGVYDLSRVHAGAFLNNPSTSPFIIEKGYFNDIGSIPWYEKHPFSGFFYKLFANKYFTFIYLFIIGIVIIEGEKEGTISFMPMETYYQLKDNTERIKEDGKGGGGVRVACYSMRVQFIGWGKGR